MKTITGTWNYPDGTPVASGVLYLKLSQDAVATNTAQIAPRVLAITLNASGQIPANTQIFANDELSPSGTFYKCSVVAPGGMLVWGEDDFSITGASPINMSSLVPVVSAGSPVYSQLQQITLQTNGVNNGSQSKLNLKNGTNITITDDGAGGVTVNTPTVTVPTSMSPLKRWMYIIYSEVSTAPVIIGAGSVTPPNSGLPVSTAVQGTASGDPPGQLRGVQAGAAAGNYITSYTSSAYPIQKNPHATSWNRPSDANTVNSSGSRLVPLVLFDQTGANGSNYFSNSFATDPTTLGNQVGFIGVTNGGTANWKAFCTAAGVQTIADTGIVIDTTAHTFEIVINFGTNVQFKMDGTVVATIATNIPASGTLLHLYFGGFQVTNAAATQLSCNIAYGYMDASF